MLVGEDDYDVLAREKLLDLLWQMLQRVLVRHRALAGGDDDEQMVLGNGGSEARHLVPMVHLHKLDTHLGMAVAHILVDESQRVGSAVEDGATLEVHRQAGHTLQPAVEARLKLCPRRHRHLYAAYGAQRLLQTSHDDLPVQAVEQALVKLAPEACRHLLVHVHAYDDL